MIAGLPDRRVVLMLLQEAGTLDIWTLAGRARGRDTSGAASWPGRCMRPELLAKTALFFVRCTPGLAPAHGGAPGASERHALGSLVVTASFVIIRFFFFFFLSLIHIKTSEGTTVLSPPPLPVSFLTDLWGSDVMPERGQGDRPLYR